MSEAVATKTISVIVPVEDKVFVATNLNGEAWQFAVYLQGQPNVGHGDPVFVLPNAVLEAMSEVLR